MVPDLNTYMDLTKTTDRQEFQRLAEQWEKSLPGKRNMFKQVGGYKYGYQYSEGNRSGQTQGSNNSTGKKPLTCFSCGKVGHLSRECRSRLLDTHKQMSTSVSPVDVKPIICFTCHEVGHKSPQCPKRPKDKVKRVVIPENKIVRLAQNDVMSEIAGKKVPLTFDTGAQISLVPNELVSEEEFTGKVSKFKGINSKGEWSEGRVAKVTFTVGADKFVSKAVALPGESIDWTAVLSVDVADEDLIAKMLKHIRKKRDLPQTETHYLPPQVKEGSVQGAVFG